MQMASKIGIFHNLVSNSTLRTTRRELEQRQQELDRMESMHQAERERREEMRKRHMEDEEMRMKQMGVRGGEPMRGGGGGGGMSREEEMRRRQQEEEFMRREEMMRMRGGLRGGMMGPGGQRGDGILGAPGRGDGLMGSPEGMRRMKGEGSPRPLMHGNSGEPDNKRSRWN